MEKIIVIALVFAVTFFAKAVSGGSFGKGALVAAIPPVLLGIWAGDLLLMLASGFAFLMVYLTVWFAMPFGPGAGYGGSGWDGEGDGDDGGGGGE